MLRRTSGSPELVDCVEDAAPTLSVAPRLSLAGVFAGVGGFEVGFARHGYESALLCDADEAALAVLKARFPSAEFSTDVRQLVELPAVDVVTAGFPCQDLSQVGSRKGIDGPNSSLVGFVLELLSADRANAPRWIVLENVPFMLRLHAGRAMSRIVDKLEANGWSWAYRTVDSRAFGLPQRRRRVVLLASREKDPRVPLLGQDAGRPQETKRGRRACGFYWTEGNTGIGWAVDAVPPLKGGSGVHIPSPPAIWFRGRRFIGTPSLGDAERLQGFEAGWTEAAAEVAAGHRRRWRLVGNAVSVPMSAWLAGRLSAQGSFDAAAGEDLQHGAPWPAAAWGVNGLRRASTVSDWPVREKYVHLASFLQDRAAPLSARATAGFLQRLRNSTLAREQNFEKDLARHAKLQQKVESRRRRRARG